MGRINTAEADRIPGALFIIRCNADEDDRFTLDYCKELIEKYQVENFFFYGRNSENFTRFSKEIRSMVKNEPLLSADFERGVATNSTGGTDFPGNMALAAACDPELAYRQGQAIAREMKHFGLNWNFAPCIDVNYEQANPVVNIRSFGDDPKQVAVFGEALSRGLEDEGVLSCLKHFPGHGSVREDSHTVLPVLSKNLEQLSAEDLYPFRAVIKSRVSSAVMIGHLVVPALQKKDNLPASLSSEVISFLKNEYGFQGLILPDALEMAGIMDIKTPYGACVEAIKAGNHFILAPLEIEKERENLSRALDSGYLELQAVQERCRQISDFKQKAARNTYYGEAVDWEKHGALSLEIARRSITALHFNKPLRRDERILVLNCYNKDEQKLTIWKDRFRIRQELEKRGFQKVREEFYSTEQEEFPAFSAENYDRIIIAVYLKIVLGRTSRFPEQYLQNLVQLQKDAGSKTLIFSLADPYVAVNNFIHDQVLLSYSNSEVSHQAVIEVATGERSAEGKLPFRRR